MTSKPKAAMGYVVLTGIAAAEADGFNAYCPELGIATCGDTVAEVLDGLSDAIQVYIADWDDPADLARMLRQKGVAVKTAPLPAAAVKASVPLGKILRVYVQPVPAPTPVAV